MAGPGLVHTGAAPYLVDLIERDYVQVLFAGNGLAVHDIETALYGTSLGVYLDKKSAPAKAMNIISGRSTRSEKPAESGKRSNRGSFSVEYFTVALEKAWTLFSLDRSATTVRCLT